MFPFFSEDDDECCLGTFCPTNSSCSNSIGSFQCTCSEGFMVNGTICQGRAENIIFDNCIKDNIWHLCILVVS